MIATALTATLVVAGEEAAFNAILKGLLITLCKAYAERLVRELLRRLIERSPVGTGPNAGLFRSNWRVGVNEADLTVTRNTTPAPPTLPTWQVGDTIYITNALSYAHGLEMGHSAQAPTGVVGVTVAELMTGALSVPKG